ncbi:MAG: hypothetical protein JXR77_07865 [Lentisphaeria bacterium]|nr:hypothetical protein [Lentisphaeria bacterium]
MRRVCRTFAIGRCMDPEEAYGQLRQKLDGFFLLNPDFPSGEIEEMYRLADVAGSERFHEVGALADRLIRAFVTSPQKRIAAATLEEYFQHLDQSARLLVAKGELGREPGGSGSSAHSVALVPSELYTPLEWCRVLNSAQVPHGLIKAVEACRRRNELVNTVLEYLFNIMLRLDTDKAVAWQLGFLEGNRGSLDPDVVRDLINAWLGREDVPRELLGWAEAWSADDNLMQQWPQVVRRADRLLCRHALRCWQGATNARNSALAHLQLLIRNRRTDDEALLRWLKSALVDIGECILRFVSLSRSAETDAATARDEWRSGAIVREIARLESLFTPVNLTADLILGVPDGANLFAVAFFGLVGKGKELWEAKLAEFAEEAVRRAFLTALRDGTSPEAIVRRLTFGDMQAYEKAMAALDIVTMNFDSIKQREKVVRHLAVYYASYHAGRLLGEEVSRRYRNLMRLMHEDHLRRVLTPEHFEDVMGRTILRELAVVAADARRFLTRRRALESSLEELIAAEMEFIQSIRVRRLRLIHTLLG